MEALSIFEHQLKLTKKHEKTEKLKFPKFHFQFSIYFFEKNRKIEISQFSK